MKNHPTSILTRSVFAFSLGCTLAVLPLSGARAQDAEKPTTSQAVPEQPQTAGTSSSTGSNSTMPVKAKKGVKSNLTAKDKQFMNKAAGGNAAEVQLAELALKNAESQAVKDFAQMMITDHTQANKDLLQLGSDEGLANFKVQVSPEDKATFGRMSVLKGTTFDTAYTKHAVVDHTDDVKEYKQEQGMTKNAGLKAYVDKVEPIIEGHLKNAKELEATKSTAVNS